MEINVHTDRLVLDGLAVEHSTRFRAAAERELADQLTAQGMGQAYRLGGARSYVDAGKIVWGKSKGEAHLGNQIVHAILGGIGGKN